MSQFGVYFSDDLSNSILSKFDMLSTELNDILLPDSKSAALNINVLIQEALGNFEVNDHKKQSSFPVGVITEKDRMSVNGVPIKCEISMDCGDEMGVFEEDGIYEPLDILDGVSFEEVDELDMSDGSGSHFEGNDATILKVDHIVAESSVPWSSGLQLSPTMKDSKKFPTEEEMLNSSPDDLQQCGVISKAEDSDVSSELMNCFDDGDEWDDDDDTGYIVIPISFEEFEEMEEESRELYEEAEAKADIHDDAVGSILSSDEDDDEEIDSDNSQGLQNDTAFATMGEISSCRASSISLDESNNSSSSSSSSSTSSEFDSPTSSSSSKSVILDQDRGTDQESYEGMEADLAFATNLLEQQHISEDPHVLLPPPPPVVISEEDESSRFEHVSNSEENSEFLSSTGAEIVDARADQEELSVEEVAQGKEEATLAVACVERIPVVHGDVDIEGIIPSQAENNDKQAIGEILVDRSLLDASTRVSAGDVCEVRPDDVNDFKGSREEEGGAPDELERLLVAGGFSSPAAAAAHPVDHVGSKQATGRRESQGGRRRSEIMGQHRFIGVDKALHSFFNLKVIFEPNRTGFEETKELNPPKGTIIAGRYQVSDFLGQAAFSTALQCLDLIAEEDEPQWVCLKVIKNSKDFFDQSLDEIKLLQYINSQGDPDTNHVLQMIDFFYCKEHLFIVSELLRENLYDFGKYVRDNNLEPYYTISRLKKITKQVLEALDFIHSLNLIHCDLKPENIVIKSYSRCEVKLIDFGSSCFTTDHLTTYIQSRSYRAPEVILGHSYDTRIDIWSVGGVLAELYTGYVLFQNDSVATMLARIVGICGPFPPHVLQQSKERRKFFTLDNQVYDRTDSGLALVYPKKTTLAARLHLPTDGRTRDNELFLDFVRRLLDLDPLRRVTAAEALQHPWLEGADDVVVPYPILTAPCPQQDDASTTGGSDAI